MKIAIFFLFFPDREYLGAFPDILRGQYFPCNETPGREKARGEIARMEGGASIIYIRIYRGGCTFVPLVGKRVIDSARVNEDGNTIPRSRSGNNNARLLETFGASLPLSTSILEFK